MANEKRLISYDVLINHLDSCIKEGKGLFKSVCIAIKCFVEQIPTVDAVEVVHGRWLVSGMCDHKQARFRNPDKWTIYKCSECGYGNGRRKNANYCPNCGAKMDLEG